MVNPCVRALLSSPLGRQAGRLSLLRFTGRRTGRRYAVPVLVYDVDGEPTVFTDGAWAANFRGGHLVTVVGRGRGRTAVADLVQDPEAVGTALRAVLAEERSPRRLGLDIDAGHEPTDNELCAVRVMIRIRNVTGQTMPGTP